MKIFIRHVLIVSALLFVAFPVHAAPEDAYARVQRTGELRCGYVDYPPHLVVDRQKHKLSGISYQLAEEMGRLLDLKIVWTEELGWDDTIKALQEGRVDAICTSFWQNAVEGRYVGFTIPLFFSAVGAYVREDEKKIMPDLSNLNRPSFRIAAADGAMAETVALQDFPQAARLLLPNLTKETELLDVVEQGEADITFVETYLGAKYIAAHPKSLVNLSRDNPVRVFGNTFAIPIGNVKLKSMLDSALVQMLYSGRVYKAVQKYNTIPHGIFMVAPPYEGPE